MARARNIKPGFFTNDLLAELDPLGRLLFAGLWTLADREGRLEDRPKKIKAQTLPYDDCNCDALLQDLHKHGFILRYVSGENRFIQIVKWGEHQNPHVKESESTIPAPDKNSASTVQAEKIPERAGLIPDSLNPITDSLNPITAAPKPRGETYSDEFEQVWAIYPERPGASKKETYKAWNARLKAGVEVEDMRQGARNYAAYVRIKKTEPDYIKQPATFFGPAEHFKADWTPTVSNQAAARLPHADRRLSDNDEAKRLLFGTLSTEVVINE